MTWYLTNAVSCFSPRTLIKSITHCGHLFVSPLGPACTNHGGSAIAYISTLSSTNVWISALCTQAMPPNVRLALKTKWDMILTTQLAHIITIVPMTALSDGRGASTSRRAYL